MTGYLVEYWPNTKLVKMIVAFEGDEVPKGCDFVRAGDPIPDPTPAPLTSDQLLVVARAERDRLLTYATLRINPLQYAADLDEASAEDLTLLKSWKKYSSAVNKTESNPGWPESPQWPEPPVPIV